MTPPLRARLHWYQLTTAEFAVLTAMCEANSGGSNVFASLATLARNAKLSSRQVRRLIHGYTDPRTGERRKGFLERGILTLLAKPGRRRTATYCINEEALDLVPEQQQLPGILNPVKVGAPRTPIGDQGPIAWPLCSPVTDTVSAVPGHGDRFTPDTVSADSKAFESDSRSDSNSKQHGFAEVTIGNCDPNTAKAIYAWTKIKTQLQLALEPSEFSQWVRPTCVLRVMGDCIQLTHPPDGRITEKLRGSLELQRLVREAGYGGALFAGYPDNYELQKLAERFPEAYDSIAPALKKRAESAA